MSGRPVTARQAIDATAAGSFVHVDRLPGTPAAATVAAQRARDRGELIPVRRGLYFKGPVEPTAEQVAREVLGPGGGPTGHTAAAVFGLAAAPAGRPTFVAVSTPPTGVDRYIAVARRTNQRRILLTWVEIALFEVLRDWETITPGGWPAVAAAGADAIQNQQIRLDCLRWAAETEKHRGTRISLARLVLESVG